MPHELIEVAATTGYRAVCLFLESMDVLPRMPRFSLVDDRAARREAKVRMTDLGISLDLAYPFTLAGRTEVRDFKPSLEAAADLDARFVNVLMYDRDPERRLERLAQFCALATSFDLGVVVEFFPASQIPSLTTAAAQLRALDGGDTIGINVDLLHLYRSGGDIAQLAATSPEHILYAQYCDAPLQRDAAQHAYEASSDRMLAGDGALDLRGFSQALPPNCLASIELPRDAAIDRGLSQQDRARAALSSVLRAIER
ncbi:sugar phosphate isomerase/epimerase family protein [Novosphingobium aquimarinum]|uniref:sugar phosphate isomerase/epimerase family protein n=1 Tax=Novosphingobium aquimarinum TaxID=2682494 RepID=UPI001E625A13|nr:TIM barrel protein [Novosphingobium aquimarinum]